MFDEICSNAKKCDVQKFEWGEVAWLHEPDSESGQRLSAGLVKFFPGKTQRQHIHFGEEQILYVIEGQGMHMLNGQQEEIHEGMLIYCPPYSKHEVINSGNKDLIFLIAYTPAWLMETAHNVSAIHGGKLPELIEPDVLKNIQSQVTEMLGLPVSITDSGFNPVAGDQEIQRFFGLCRDSGICCDNHKTSSKGKAKNGNRLYECCPGVMKITVPIEIGDEILGYINSGCFLINKPENYKGILEHELSRKLQGSNQLQEIIDAYDKLPLLTKSRLYTLQEALETVAKIISGITENNMVEKELKKKNTEILKNTEDIMNLEDALKQANLKLMQTKPSSTLRSNISLGSFLTKRNMEYPIVLEEAFASAIEKLDMEAVKAVLKDLMDFISRKELPANIARDMLDEMLMSLCRIVYGEFRDEDTFLAIRYKYKARLGGCNDFHGFQELLMDMAEELADIIRNRLLRGSHGLIHKVNLYIKNNYNQDINLNSLADIFYISPNYLSTLFNEKNGMNLKDYINKLRIEKAKEYLHETDLKISEISRKVGFRQISYFGSVFKKLEHCTPKQWRVRL